MPIPKHKCAKANCHTLIPVEQRYCELHTGERDREYNAVRKRNHAEYIKFYHSTQWRNARRLQLLRQPLCEICLAKDEISKATTVHHLIETKIDWSKRLEESNLQSVCKSCHESLYKGRWY